MKPILFCKVNWMQHYRGLDGDSIVATAAFVKKHGYGHEIFNNQPWRRMVYGFVQAKDGRIAIERLGASPEASSLSNVLVVWVSPSPLGGVRVIGWYKNATVFRDWQPAPNGSGRTHKGDSFGYNVVAKASDCTFLALDRRALSIPKRTMVRTHVWFAEGAGYAPFRRKVWSFASTGVLDEEGRKRRGRGASDPDRRWRIEEAAVRTVTSHYESLGYGVESVEKDNRGWDLECRLTDAQKLLVEVKGLSQDVTCVDLTYNEYVQLKRHRESYRVAVVTRALDCPRLAVFSWSPESEKWEDEDRRVMTITEYTAARLECE